MKIAIVTAYPPSKSTLNEYGYHLVKKFVQKDEVSELVLITDKTDKPKQLDFSNSHKVTVDQCWKFNSCLTIFMIVKAILKSKPDVVLFNLQFLKFGNKKIPAALGLLIPMVLKMFGYNTVVLLHNIIEQVNLIKNGFASSEFEKKTMRFFGTILTKCLLKADVVVVSLSKYVDILNTKYKTNNVTLIPYGAFETSHKVNFDLPLGPKKILAFGKFGTYKKLDVAIEAIKLIRQNNRDLVELVIAGTDSPNAPGYMESIKEKYSDHEGITFMGYVEENDVEKVFCDCAIVALPYNYTTGSSGVLHLAGTYGKAIAMPNIADFAQLSDEEGYKGEFFNPESSNSLAKAIKVLLLNDEYRVSLARANYNAARNLCMDKTVDMYLDRIKEIQTNKIKKLVVSNV